MLVAVAAIAAIAAVAAVLSATGLRSPQSAPSAPIAAVTASPTPLPTPAPTASSSATASPGPSPIPTLAASVLSDRFGFVWVVEPGGLHVRSEMGAEVGTLPALPYSFSRCGCAVSPDGLRIAYWTTRTAPDNVELRIADAGRPGATTTIYRAPRGTLVVAAAWSSDGTGILFATESTNTGGPAGATRDPALHVMDASGGALRTLDRGAGSYVPLGWDRASGVAAAALSGEGGHMSGYLTVRTSGDPAPARTGMTEGIFVMSVEVSSDQRYALGIFYGPAQPGATIRWWRLGDFAPVAGGPRVADPFGAKWRPGSTEIGWVEGGILRLFDIERGTTRTIGSLPGSSYTVAAFRHDGTAVAASAGESTIVMDIGSGRSERVAGAQHIAAAVRFR